MKTQILRGGRKKREMSYDVVHMKGKSISIGIPSYNEGENLIRILKQIERDKRKYNLNIIEVIISDDSDDETPILMRQHLEKIKYPFDVRYIHHRKRRGQAGAWNEIFRESVGDIIILYDGDIIFGNKTTYNLIRKLESKSEYGIVGGKTVSIQIGGLASEATYIISQWLHEIRKLYPDSQFTIMGRVIAIKKEIAKKIYLSRDVVAVDLYLQCMVCRMGYRVGYAENAEIYFKPPLKIREMMSQIVRATLGHRQISKLIDKYLKKIDIKEQLRIFISLSKKTKKKHIISTVIAYLIGLVYIPLIWRGAIKSIWEIASTTKIK